ncbi:MAG: type IV toxin-antitoxin system AbiEi family antitoxin domain-containing protein, partial [Raoultibacter sp.]
MKAFDKLKDCAKENGGIISSMQAQKKGVSRTTLSHFVDKGLIARIGHGQYILSDSIEDELFALSKRSSYLVFSHETALFLHGISERTPFEHAITLPSNKRASQTLHDACKIYYVKPELHELGKTTISTLVGNPVPAYDMERTICDIVRSRSRIGDELLLSSLKMYVGRSDKNLNTLNTYAEQLSIASVLRKYLEVLL